MLRDIMGRWHRDQGVKAEDRSYSILQRREMDKLRQEIKQALADKRATEQMFHYAKGNDEVEWAILKQLAAEQRYRMLLNKARAMDVDWTKIRGFVI